MPPMRLLALLLLGLLAATAARAGEELRGRVLVASEALGDRNFAATLVLVVEHDPHHALGLVLNRPLQREAVARLMRDHLRIVLPPERLPKAVYGGPVQPTRLIALHGSDYHAADSREVTGAWAVSGGVELLRALAAGAGPQRVLLAFGYAGWGPGQLDAERRRGDWLVVAPTEALLFDSVGAQAWRHALALAGPQL